jgi:hypothetical protein
LTVHREWTAPSDLRWRIWPSWSSMAFHRWECLLILGSKIRTLESALFLAFVKLCFCYLGLFMCFAVVCWENMLKHQISGALQLEPS